MNEARVEVRTSRPYEVRIGPGALARDGWLPGDGRVAVLVDARVLELHAARLRALRRAPTLAVRGGEDCKRLERLGEVLEFLVDADLDRGSTLVVVGGGTVCDLGGLAASLFLRGIAWIACPTTLLAQVDASIGGKTAINLSAGKNLAGTFHQPRLVVADTETLGTLPAAERRSGLGEVVKTALLDGEEALARLEARAEALLALDPVAVAEVVAACVAHKAAVVARDEHEAGERAQLNLGHTFAHAIESVAGFGAVAHGEAVAVGLVLALELAGATGLLADAELPRRVARLLELLGLPSSLEALRSERDLALPPDDLVAAMGRDKKRAGGEPHFVLPVSPGLVRTGVPVARALLDAILC